MSRRSGTALGFDLAEIPRTPIPKGSPLRIAAQAVHPGAVEKGRIKGYRHAHRRSAVACIGGALKEEPGRGNIARTEKGVAARHESYMAKIAGTELGFRVADRCMQIHGGMGLATEMPISKMWRDARSFMITEGPVEVMRWVLAREILRGY